MLYVIFFFVACAIMYVQHKEIRSLRTANEQLATSHKIMTGDLHNCGESLQRYERAFTTLEKQDPSMTHKFDWLINGIQTK